MKPTPEVFANLVETVRRLRAPGGCPWDRAQTHKSLKPYVIEEACELADILETIPENNHPPAAAKGPLVEELGDVLMQVLIHSEIGAETQEFSLQDVIQGLNDKLIRRHPHVFGDKKVDDAGQALATWNAQKAAEKAKNNTKVTILGRIPKSMPALERSKKFIDAVTEVGFQWNTPQESMVKVREEFAELEEALQGNDAKALEHEIGDCLFALCNLSYLLKQDPVQSLKKMLDRFETRFEHVEKGVQKSGRSWKEHRLEDLDVYWNAAKKQDGHK